VLSVAVVVLVFGMHAPGASLQARNADSAGLRHAVVLVPAWNENPVPGVPSPCGAMGGADAPIALEAVQPAGTRAERQESETAESARGWRGATSWVFAGDYCMAGGRWKGVRGGGRHPNLWASARKSNGGEGHGSCLVVGRRCECA